jgi:glutamine amidotransferase
MARLQAAGLTEVIPQLTQPLLGICLGMQLLFQSSAESAAGQDSTPGLGVMAGKVQRLAAAPDRPVPHMGWNQLTALRVDPLLDGIAAADYVYFVHSFAAPVTDATVAVTGYGQQFASVVRRENFRGVQFHPERSATVGARLLANFLAIRE